MKISKRFRNMLMVFGVIPISFMTSPIVIRLLGYDTYKEIEVASDWSTMIVAILYILLILNWSEQGD